MDESKASVLSRIRLGLGLLALATVLIIICQCSPPAPPPPQPPPPPKPAPPADSEAFHDYPSFTPADAPGDAAVTASKLPGLSPDLPYDVNTNKDGTYIKDSPEDIRQLVKASKLYEAHRQFGLLAWQAFIALNWPAYTDGPNEGQPNEKANLSDNTTWRVWDYWRPAGSIFLPEGAAPATWDSKWQNSEALRPIANVPRATVPIAARNNFEAFTGPLVDQHGKWARFEIRVNKEEFD